MGIEGERAGIQDPIRTGHPGNPVESGIIRFSVIILTYNRPGFLQECIKSALKQDYHEPFEILVVDDGSTDSTGELVRALAGIHRNIVYIRHEMNLGVGAARNTGIRYARGEYMAFIADDYVLPADYLLRADVFFTACADAEIMSCRLQQLDEQYWELVQYYVYDTIYTRLMVLSPITCSRTSRYVFIRLPELDTVRSSMYLPPRPAAVFRRSVLERFQFAGAMRSNEDADLSIRLREAGIPVYLNSEIRIRAHFGEHVRDHIRKEYAHGRDSRVWFPGKNPHTRAVAQFLGGIMDALIVVRQTRDMKEYITLFPGVFLVIMAFRLGYLIAPGRREPLS
jgi:glycosyltransferase involved in cell wall biosynthesis